MEFIITSAKTYFDEIEDSFFIERCEDIGVKFQKGDDDVYIFLDSIIQVDSLEDLMKFSVDIDEQLIIHGGLANGRGKIKIFNDYL